MGVPQFFRIRHQWSRRAALDGEAMTHRVDPKLQRLDSTYAARSWRSRSMISVASLM